MSRVRLAGWAATLLTTHPGVAQGDLALRLSLQLCSGELFQARVSGVGKHGDLIQNLILLNLNILICWKP